MIKFNTLGDAIRLAEAAHFTQVDKAGLPYIEHPKRVLEKVKAQGALPYVQMAAILHDVTEDTKYTPEIMSMLGFPESTVEIVKLLDRNYSFAVWKELDTEFGNHESFPDSDTFYYDRIREHPGALMVKLADIEDNLSDWRMTYLSEETQARLREKYANARRLLQPGVWTNPYYPAAPPKKQTTTSEHWASTSKELWT